jgi:hypothetical protein
MMSFLLRHSFQLRLCWKVRQRVIARVAKTIRLSPLSDGLAGTPPTGIESYVPFFTKSATSPHSWTQNARVLVKMTVQRTPLAHQIRSKVWQHQQSPTHTKKRSL